MIAAIILGSMGFIVFCIAIWIGYHYWVRAKRDIEDELRLLSQRLVQIQEKERQSIARELHDQIGQSLTVLQLVLDRSKKECAPAVQAQIEEGQAVVTELISTVRNISLNLRPAILKAQEWGARIPIGVIYKEKRATFEELHTALRKGPLVKQEIKPESVAKLLAEFY